MESTLQKTALVAAITTPKAKTIVYWIVTALFCLEMSFTAYYALLRLPQAAQAFTRLGFSHRVSGWSSRWAKLLGVVACCLPTGAGAAQGMGLRRLRHQPRLGAHRPPLDGRSPGALVPSTITSVLWGLSYFFWRRLQATPASSRDRAPPGSFRLQATLSAD